MFEKTYTFETKATRGRRLIISGVSLFLLITAVLVSFIVYIPIYARLQKAHAADALFQKSPDAIAVFTGDKGRIAYALDLLKKNPTSKLFISGVHAANSLKTLTAKQTDESTEEFIENLDLLIDLDYISKDTFENVRETVLFLNQNPYYDNVLIISSDYHIMRIKLIISHYLKGDKPEFYFDSVATNFDSWNDIKKLLLESVKLVRTFVLLKIFRENIVDA